MERISSNVFHHQPPNSCLGCFKSETELSSIDSDEDELNDTDAFRDHYLERHRTAKPKEITNRPCFHFFIKKTPSGKLNLAALQLSYDLIENIDHLPEFIETVDICSPDSFYELVGCTKDSIDVYTDLIVAKLIPEDIEDEENYEQFFQYLVDEKKFGLIGLPLCKIFKAFYLLPLPKEKEPSVFMPIASRLNLEKAPREDNHLLGLLVRKPPREEGEISEKEDTPATKQEVSQPPKSQLLSPVSPESPPMSHKRSTSSEGSSKSYGPLPRITVPANRYDSFIGRSTESIPFLTDNIDDVINKAGPSKKEETKKIPKTSFGDSLEQISSSENELEYSTQESSNRKRSRSRSRSIDAKLKVSEPTQNKVRASSSSSFFSTSHDKSKSSSTLKTKIEKLSPEKSKSVIDLQHDEKTFEIKEEKIETIDIDDSSNSDPDADFFPRPSNIAMSGTFYAGQSNFAFKYEIISSKISKSKDIKKYLPSSLTQKGRANTSETELFLTSEMQRPERTAIAFQILPCDSVNGKENFRNYVVDLHKRSRYGILAYTPDSYRAFVFPCIKGNDLMKAFEICNLKPSFKQESQLYGIIVKKTIPKKDVHAKARHRSASSATSTDMPSPTSSLPLKVAASSSSRDNKPQKKSSDNESPSSYQTENLDSKNYPGLESDKLIEIINSAIDDPCKLSATLSNLVHKAIAGQNLEAQIDAAEECRQNLRLIIVEEERQYAKKQQAYKMALDILTTIHKSLSNSKS